MNELCYATSKSPTKDYVCGGVIISNADLHISTYKPAEKPMNCGDNNHGSIIEIKEDGIFFITDIQTEMSSAARNVLSP